MKENTLEEAQKYETQKKKVEQEKEKIKGKKKMKKIYEVFFPSNLVRVI